MAMFGAAPFKHVVYPHPRFVIVTNFFALIDRWLFCIWYTIGGGLYLEVTVAVKTGFTIYIGC